jgi:hypothetical protein
MNPARARSGKAYTELSSVFRVRAGHECGGFFMAHLNEPDFVGAISQRFHDSVDAIAWQSEHDLDAPIVDRVDENIGGCGFHSWSA